VARWYFLLLSPLATWESCCSKACFFLPQQPEEHQWRSSTAVRGEKFQLWLTTVVVTPPLNFAIFDAEMALNISSTDISIFLCIILTNVQMIMKTTFPSHEQRINPSFSPKHIFIYYEPAKRMFVLRIGTAFVFLSVCEHHCGFTFFKYSSKNGTSFNSGSKLIMVLFSLSFINNPLACLLRTKPAFAFTLTSDMNVRSEASSQDSSKRF